MPVSSIVRRFIPLEVRQEIKHHLRVLRDTAHGIRFDRDLLKGDLLNDEPGSPSTQQPIQLVQPIQHSSFYENKIINITRGAALLNQNLIRADQSWSFWHRIQRPNSANGFVAGRNLVNGELVAQSGGGLCQIASMAYHLALLAGLTILERHSHSIDIYQEHQRFTPLGADATVVWGFKDLRLHNPYPFAVSFEFSVQNGQLLGKINTEAKLMAQLVEFVRIPLQKPFVQVNTLIDHKIVKTTVYEQRQGIKVVSTQP
jgi:vancomycin resistance protein VanW